MFIESAGEISSLPGVFGYWCGHFNLESYLVSRHKWNEHLLLWKRFTSFINLDNEEKKKKKKKEKVDEDFIRGVIYVDFI